MRTLILALAAVALGACAPTTTQLASMSDQQICAVAHSYPMRLDVSQFIGGRGLRCHPAQEACDAAGYGPQDPQGHLACTVAMLRQMRVDKAETDRKWQAFAQGLQQYPRNVTAYNQMWQSFQPPLGSAGNPIVVQTPQQPGYLPAYTMGQ